MAREGLMDDAGYNFFDVGDCSNYEDCRADAYQQGRTDTIDEYNKKIDYLKNCYVDACNMCTRVECDVCAISNFIEDLKQLKEQK